jgi:aminoglycoside phosphotransferase (APT) family kinase protein
VSTTASPAPDAAAYAELLRSVWPGESVSVGEPAPFGEGHSGVTYLLPVVTDSFRGDLVVRLSPEGARIAGPADVGRQGRIMGALHSAGLPAPRVLVADSSGGFCGRAVTVMYRVRGATWEEIARTRPHAEIAEEAVAVLHRIRDLPLSLTGIGGEPVTGNEAEVARWSGLSVRCPDWLIGPARELAGKLLSGVPALSRAALVHGDFHYANLLFGTASVVAVFDWEIASIGDPLTDLGCLAVASLRRRYAPEPNPTGSVAVTLRDLSAIYGADEPEAAWHIAAACLKYAVILGYNLQLHRRGKKPDPIYEQLVGTARYLLQDGAAILANGLRGY